MNFNQFPTPILNQESTPAEKNETNIPDEKYEELKKQWKVLSSAVGMVNKGMVDHTR